MFALLIPIAVPLITALLKKAIPALPGKILPVLAPVLGVVCAVGDALATGGVLDGATLGAGAVMGSAGVGVREVYDQNIKRRRR